MASHRRFVGPVLDPVVTGPRAGRMRDRRGRGARGPVALPGPLSPDSVPMHLPGRALFDRLVTDTLRSLEAHLVKHGIEVEVMVEEAPLLPLGWDEAVPTSVVLWQNDPVRLVLYRLPLTQASGSTAALEHAVREVVTASLAQVWQVPVSALA